MPGPKAEDCVCGIPFTLAAVLTGYVYLWLVWGA